MTPIKYSYNPLFLALSSFEKVLHLKFLFDLMIIIFELRNEWFDLINYS